METVTVPKKIIADLVAAIECVQAMEMPYGKGCSILNGHGWNEVTDPIASRFVSNSIKEFVPKKSSAASGVLGPG